MKPVCAFCLCLAVSGVSLAQSSGATPDNKKFRTSPVGYSDTPQLPGQKWKVHDIDRPHPKKIDAGTFSTQQTPGTPPSDAVVLFDGKDLSHWLTNGGKGKRGQGPQPAAWKVEKGYMEIVPGSGTIFSKEKFGDMQLHIEFREPTVPSGTSQWRGNSGVLLMSNYEIQVLDSYDSPTYADGQAAAIYGQWPPMVNASRKPGEWQTYDIAFEAPQFEGEKLVSPGYVTVFHNGVLVHHHQKIIGRMAHRVVGTYAPHGAEEPLALQDHDVPVQYRNIWVRRINGYDQK